MFTGSVPLEKFKHEHGGIPAPGGQRELKDYLVDAPSRPMTTGSKILGFVLMAIGVILFVLIMIGFIDSLLDTDRTRSVRISVNLRVAGDAWFRAALVVQSDARRTTYLPMTTVASRIGRKTSRAAPLARYATAHDYLSVTAWMSASTPMPNVSGNDTWWKRVVTLSL